MPLLYTYPLSTCFFVCYVSENDFEKPKERGTTIVSSLEEAKKYDFFIPFPCDLQDLHEEFFLTNNRLGVIFNDHWGITVSRDFEGKFQLYLMDRAGEMREIEYKKFHLAVAFKSWKDFDRNEIKFLSILNRLRKYVDILFAFNDAGFLNPTWNHGAYYCLLKHNMIGWKANIDAFVREYKFKRKRLKDLLEKHQNNKEMLDIIKKIEKDKEMVFKIPEGNKAAFGKKISFMN